MDRDPVVDLRVCDHPGCTETGEFRAPKSRETLGEYFWFCLDHVREYNKAWNYFAGMSDVEVERIVRKDTVWDRPELAPGSLAGSGAAYSGEVAASARCGNGARVLGTARERVKQSGSRLKNRRLSQFLVWSPRPISSW